MFRKNLVDSNFIVEETSASDFKAIFRNQQSVNPIRWDTNKSNITELSYLIKQLHNNLKLIDNVGYNKWKIANKCFVDIKGNSFGWQRLFSVKPKCTELA